MSAIVIVRIVDDVEAREFWTGFGWSSEYPDALHVLEPFQLREVDRAARTTREGDLLALENYGLENEREVYGLRIRDR